MDLLFSVTRKTGWPGKESMRYQEAVVQDPSRCEGVTHRLSAVISPLALGGILTVSLDISAVSASYLLVGDEIWLPQKER